MGGDVFIDYPTTIETHGPVVEREGGTVVVHSITHVTDAPHARQTVPRAAAGLPADVKLVVAGLVIRWLVLGGIALGLFLVNPIVGSIAVAGWFIVKAINRHRDAVTEEMRSRRDDVVDDDP